ncbi:hypothetical protein PRZ48_002768 [Zasmidium cellare]|uniref:Potassium channel tetramerisation-type BTB domain-containing protein n=1 Tax=Zasmidium cellare TaxID=395010 RepID=A0ABR0EUD6_ZASCE|nr:hypothetical protein PRZ48_002768 [Zasmidium cellare]
MPSNAARGEERADIETSNLGTRLDHDASGSKTAARGNTKTAKTSAQMASANKTPSGADLDEGLDTIEKTDAKPPNTARTTKANSNSREDSLQVPDSGNSNSNRRPIETSIWDWDTPLDSVGESTSYYYEPQGELLQEQREPRSARGEFNIPTVVPGSGLNWPFHGANGTIDSQDFAVPRRPTGNTPASLLGVKRKSTSEQSPKASSRADKRMSRTTMSDSGEDSSSPTDTQPPSHNTRSQSGPNTRGRGATEASESRRGQGIDMESLRPPFGGAIPGTGPRRMTDPGVPMVLPARKVFPIQIGDKLFRLSGASISSDAPSYFSQFFEEQLRQSEGADSVRTLYIDRDPATFEDIALHLQGYHIEPKDGKHFVKLFADAQFFSLPRLTAQLFSSTIYIRIGDEEFQIPRDLFSNPGDSPNYFSLGFSMFFTTPSDAFPGLSQRSLLRPPTILPPSVPNRSAKTFADLMHVLKGYPVEIRSESHRAELLRDARYFHLKGLEQRLIPHTIAYNLAWKRTEISLRLEDIRQSGVSFVGDNAAASAAPSPASSTTSSTPQGPGWIYYQRPYVDSEAYSLILEITGDETTMLAVEPPNTISAARMCRATFFKQTLSRITSLFSVIANKMNLPVTQPLGLMMMERGAGVASLPVSPRNTGVSEEKVKCRIGPDADVVVDGKRWFVGGSENETEDEEAMDVDNPRSKRRKRRGDEDDDDGSEEWILSKAQWRLRVQPVSGGVQSGKSGMEVILGAVKIEAFSCERGRNAVRGFLT